MINYTLKERSAIGTVEDAREPARPRAAEVPPEGDTPSNQSARRRARTKSNRILIALSFAVVLARAVVISPSPGMCETTPPHAGSPARKSPQPKL
jgi:hypothetical protein